MNNEKIALLIDSGTDLPQEFLVKENVFVLPLRIIFKDAEYIDNVNISSSELFAMMEKEIPSTSLPTGEDILNTLNIIREKGYKKIIAITIAGSLSGTNAAVTNIMSEYAQDLETFVIDTKNISVGAGMFAITALKAIDAGKPFSDITTLLKHKVTTTKIFFTVGSVEYLKKGGRISSFAALMSEFLNIKPVITCDANGAYTLAAKERGKKRSHEKLIKLAQDFIDNAKQKFYLVIVHGEDLEDFERFKKNVLSLIPNFEDIYSVKVSPALGVHTGADAMGISIQLLNDNFEK